MIRAGCVVRVLAVALVFCTLPSATPALMAQTVAARTRANDIAINAAITGIISALRGVVYGRRDLTPFLGGLAGGALEALGRQTAGSTFSGAGVAGRELSAIGTSIAVSASVGDTLVLIAPVGPVTLEYRPTSPRKLHPRVSLFDVVTIASAALDDRSTFAWTASLDAGAPVFLRPSRHVVRGRDENGFTQVGTIFLSRDLSTADQRLVMRHERVHVLQWDAYTQFVALPIERAATSRLPGTARFFDYVDPGVVAPLSVLALASGIRYADQPWEKEAYALVPEQGPPAVTPPCDFCLYRVSPAGIRRPGPRP